MKTAVVVKLSLTLLSFLLHTPTYADECGGSSLIRRGGSPKARIGEACAYPCDCAGYPDEKICCEKRAFGEKRCYKCCLHKGDACSKHDDCCSQTCDRGVCAAFDGPMGASMGREAPSKVGLCDMAFFRDKLGPNPPLIPDPAKPHTFIMPSKTGPLRQIRFCPLHQTDRYELGSYKLRGICEGEAEWSDIQEGDMTQFKDEGGCFNIPAGHKPHLVSNHPTKVDYTMYHFVMYQTNGKIYPRKLQVGPHPDGEIRFFAKCSEAAIVGAFVDATYGLH